MATKAEIRQTVGEDLGLVPIGGILENQDQNRIDDVFTQIYARLKAKGLATWASTASVPDEVTPYFQLLMQEKLLTSYSVPESRFLRIKNDAGEDGDKALNNIAEMVIPKYESTDQVTDF